MLRNTAGLLLWAAILIAAGADFSGPVLGYVYDEGSKSLRPLLGTPGAAVIGTAADKHRYEKAVVSGDKGIGVAFAADTVGVLRVAPQEAPLTIPEALPKFDIATLSASGSSAVLYLNECACVQIVTDLASVARVVRTVALPDGNTVRSLAITDDASVVAIGLSSGRILLHSGEQSRDIEGDAAAMAFSSDARRLAVSDDARKSVGIYTNLIEAPELVHLVTERDGLSSPKAVWFASTHRVLAGDGSGMVHVIEPEAGPLQSVGCACVPDTFARTTAADVMRITGVSSGTSWVMQTIEDRVQTLFIPMLREAEVAQ